MHRSALVAGLLVLTSAAPSAAQAVQRFALADGDTVAVTTRGSGPAVVIVPGLIGGSYAFRAVTADLTDAGFRVAVIDPLGTGASSRPRNADYSLEAQAARIERAMTEAGITEAVLLCHSIGGSICYRLALRAPARVRGLVSLNGGPDERAATNSLRLGLRFVPLIKLIGGKGMIRKRLIEGLRNSAGPDSTWLTPQNVDEYARPYDDLDATLHAMRGMASASEPVKLIPRLPDLATRVNLLVGSGATKQKVMTSQDLDHLKRIPSLRIDSISSAGQFIQEEAPAAVIAAVKAMFRN